LLRDLAQDLAAYWGSREGVAALLRAGAKVDAKDKEGQTPLHLAARFENLETMHALLEAKANPTAKDRRGRTPF
jgi:ankyrin repeat protein